MRLSLDNYQTIIRQWDEIQTLLDLGKFYGSDMQSHYFDEDETREFYEFGDVLFAVHTDGDEEGQLDDDVEVLVTAPYSAGREITKGCATLSVSAIRASLTRGQLNINF
jgi:hypothetical protein